MNQRSFDEIDSSSEVVEEYYPDERPSYFKAAFVFLLLFTIMVYLRPQEIVRQMAPFRLPLLFAGLAFLSFILGFLKYKEKLPIKNQEVRLMILLGVFLIFSIPLSVWRGGSVAFIKDIVSKGYLIFFMVVFVVNTLPRVRWLIFTLEFCGSFAALYAAYQIATGQGQMVAGRLMLPGLSGDPNDRALIMVFMLPLAVFSLFETRLKFIKAIHVFFISTYLLGIVQSLSRGGMLGLVAVIGYFAFRMMKERKGLVLTIGIAVFIGTFVISDRVITRFESIFDHSKDEVNTIDARTDIMKRYFRIMITHPVLGIGIGCAEIAYGNSLGGPGRWMTTHNSPLQIGVETGVLGLLTYLALFWIAYRNSRLIQDDFIEYDLEPSMVEFSRALEFSLVGFFVCAFFLSQAYSWHVFYLMGLSGALRRIAYTIEEEQLPDEDLEEDDEEEPVMNRHPYPHAGMV